MKYSRGRRKEGQGFWNLTFFYQFFNKKGLFINFEWVKWNFATLASPGKIFLAALGKIHFPPPPGNNPSDAHESCMLFLSPGIFFRLQALLHWRDNNAVFIDDVSRVYANSLPQKIGKKQNKVCTHTAFQKIFRLSGTRTKGQKMP